MYTFGWDGISVAWDLIEHKKLYNFPKINCRYHIAAMSHDDRYIFAGDYDNFIHIYDTVERKEVLKFDPDISGMAYDLCCTKDNKYLVAGGAGTNLCLYSLEKMSIEKHLFGHKGTIPWVAVT